MGDIAAYIRVSTVKQREEGSHERQKETIRDWAERNGHDPEAIDFYEDIAISGQSSNRDDYDELMDSFEEYDMVVVRELSRFGRDPLTILRDVQEITEEDVDFVSITEAFDTTSAMGKAMMGFLAVMNGLYSDLARERAERMHERRSEEGLPVGRHKKADDAVLEDVYEYRERGLSYEKIRILVNEIHGADIQHRSTIRRYCQEAGVEPEATA